MSDSALPKLPSEVNVKRSDPVYMAHGYLTKVPIAAIQPYIEAFTSPGDIVMDPFAGSGMTGVAALTLGRDAALFDVSVLGKHIGSNYCTTVDEHLLRKHASAVVDAVDSKLEGPYATICDRCDTNAQTSKVTRSVLVECGACGEHVSFYRSLEQADWRKADMTCPCCTAAISSKSRRVGDVAEEETVRCECSKKLIDRLATTTTWTSPVEIEVPSREIAPDRQMYIASALGKHGLTSTGSFFSDRNATVLACFKKEIDQITDREIASKLTFAFTAILARASKRYQWSRARPLNASNANYYVAPVFYEWNVFELFMRKVEAMVKSDEHIRKERWTHGAGHESCVSYENASATAIPLADNSIDYVFTDPPFGWNIFYSDMNLFHEAWLGEAATDPSLEAVIDRSKTDHTRTAERYEQMLVDSLKECVRVLKPGGWITLVFGSSAGEVWAVVQRAIARAGLIVEPESIASLHKGQRSVKGLASGFENVVTHDLIMSLRHHDELADIDLVPPTAEQIEESVAASLDETRSPSELYVRLLRDGFRNHWDISKLDLRDVTSALRDRGIEVDRSNGEWAK